MTKIEVSLSSSKICAFSKANEQASGRNEMVNRDVSPPRESSAPGVEVSKDTSEQISGSNTDVNVASDESNTGQDAGDGANLSPVQTSTSVSVSDTAGHYTEDPAVDGVLMIQNRGVRQPFVSVSAKPRGTHTRRSKTGGSVSRTKCHTKKSSVPALPQTPPSDNGNGSSRRST